MPGRRRSAPGPLSPVEDAAPPGGGGLPNETNPLVPLGVGLGWLPPQWEERAASLDDAVPAPPEHVLGPPVPGYGTPLLGWSLTRSDENAAPHLQLGGTRTRMPCVLLCARDLHVHVLVEPGATPAAAADASHWLRSLGRHHATAAGACVTSLAMLHRQSVVRLGKDGTRQYFPPYARLALVLGLTSLDGEIPPVHRLLPCPPRGTAGDALRTACALLPEQRALELNIHVHVDGLANAPGVLQPDWRGVARPDFVVSPPGTTGDAGHRALWLPVALLYQQSGRGTPDAPEAALQHLVAGALLALQRAARRAEHAAAGRTAVAGLLGSVLVVGVPSDGWQDVPNADRHLQCRAWQIDVGAGRIPVWRSRGLTVGQAVALAARHVGAHV